ncbi:hypothetical protein CY35_13G062400 [Sphagnum magellanicum]|jgi:hypothetical protein|nr:hypothetical protein CY35_13G062400 [Sphagnum magellanicum]
MRSGSYQSAYDQRIALQNIEDSKIINTEKFIYQVGPKHEKQIVATGISFGLQVPYEHKKFPRKQEKLKYAAMYPNIVEARWKVMFCLINSTHDNQNITEHGCLNLIY